MSNKEISLTREELYEKVWSIPMRTLAREYGISDVGLAKICKRHEIPRPPRGYWAKLEFGKKVKQQPLKPVDDESLQTVHLYGYDSPVDLTAKKSISDDPVISTLIAFERNPENRIIPSVDFRGVHPSVITIRNSLTKSNADEFGRVYSHLEYFEIGVSKSNIDRALLIIHTLKQVFKKRGYKMETAGSGSKQLSFNVLESSFRVSIWEKARQHRNPPPKKEMREKNLLEWLRYKTFDYVPSGVLELHLNRNEYSSEVKICDKGSQPLEERLNEFIIRMFKSIIRRRIIHEERKCEEAVAELIKQEAIAKEMKLREHLVIKENLLEMIPKWEEASQVRRFVDAVRCEAVRRFGTVEGSSETGQWLSWAEEYLKSIDPLSENQELPRHSLTDTELEQLKKECESDWCRFSKTFRTSRRY